VLPIPLPAQGKLGERRAREIKTTEDPRRLYGKLMHVLAIAIPPNAEVLDEFLKETKTLLAERKIPEATAKLMLDVLAKRLEDVRQLERKLKELQHLLGGGEE
jgi:hypothetical protein